MLKSLAILLLSAVAGSAQFIPSTNRIDWTPGVMSGVLGGIPTNRVAIIDASQPPYNADKTGITDSSAAIQAAIGAALSNQVVFLPTGTYKITSPVSFASGKNGITLRGAGTNLTKIVPTGIAIIQVGQNVALNFPTNAPVTAGLSKGSTNFTMSSTSQFAVGRMVELGVANNNAPTNPTPPYISVFAFDLYPNIQPIRKQMLMVTAKTPTSLTVWPPLYDDYSATSNLVFDTQLANTVGIGIEGIYFEMSNSVSTLGAISFNNAYNCWVSNCVVHLANNYSVEYFNCANCEIRHCLFDTLNHSGSSGSHILVENSSAFLVEDNVCLNAFPCIEVNSGSDGCVFTYNFCRNTDGKQAVLGDHNPNPCFNIYEGNFFTSFQYDSYFGGATQETVYRNWMSGEWGGGTSSNRWNFALSINRFCRYLNVIGNVLGTSTITNMPNNGCVLGQPNIGSSSFTGTGPPWLNQWTNETGLFMTGTNISSTAPAFSPALTYNGVDNLSQVMIQGTGFWPTSFTDNKHIGTAQSGSFTNVNFVYTYAQTGFQELDLDVSNTITMLGNYDYFNHAIPGYQSLGGTNLQSSYVYNSKPSYFNNCPWPPYDSTSVASISVTNTPAGFRFAFGFDPPNPATNITYGITFTHP